MNKYISCNRVSSHSHRPSSTTEEEEPEEQHEPKETVAVAHGRERVWTEQNRTQNNQSNVIMK